jgi:hypothetical protein
MSPRRIGMSQGYRPQRLTVMTLTLMFSVCALGALVSAGSDYFQLELLHLAIKGDEITEKQWLVNDLRRLGVFLAQIVLSLLTAVTFCFWMHQAAMNARLLNAVELKNSAAWAVGAFFVPIVNLVVPYLAMVELWKASDPRRTVCDQDIRAKLPVTPLLGAWWITCIMSAIVWAMSRLFLSGAADDKALASATSVSMLAAACWALCSMLGAFVVRDIAWRQDRRHEAIERFGLGEAPAPQAAKPSRAAKSSEPAETKPEAPRTWSPLANVREPDPAIKPIIPMSKSA